MFYLICTAIYVIAFYFPLPDDLEAFVDVIEFSPRWMVFIPLAFWIFQRNKRNHLMYLILTIVNFLFVLNLSLNSTKKNISETKKITLATYNIGGVSNYEAVISWYYQQQLDILLLQEAKLTNLKKALENQALRFHCAKGLCLVSQHTFTFVHALDRRSFGGWGNFAATYQINLFGAEVNLVNVHLDTPRYGFYKLRDNNYLGLNGFTNHFNSRKTESMVASMLTKRDDCLSVIGGDFNLTQQGVLYRKFWQEWNNSFSVSGKGFGYTKNSRFYGARIDHILTSNKIKVLQSYVSYNLGGDHNPLVSQILIGE